MHFERVALAKLGLEMLRSANALSTDFRQETTSKFSEGADKNTRERTHRGRFGRMLECRKFVLPLQPS